MVQIDIIFLVLSNKSIGYILNESPLVEIYRHLQEVFEESFCDWKKTTTNQGPDMTKTYTELLNMMERNDTHKILRPNKRARRRRYGEQRY